MRSGAVTSHAPDWARYPDLLPLREQFGADVTLLGCYSSGTETRAGQAALNRSTAVWFPTGRPRDSHTGKWAIAGAQICFTGSDVTAFRAAVEALPDPRRPLLSWPGHIR